MNRRRTSQRITNNMIAVLSMAMGRLSIRGHFTVQSGVWTLWSDGEDYSLAGLRSVTVTKDDQIILSLPDRALVLREEMSAIKNLSAAGNGQEAARDSLARL
jgi:hypothetical protein